MLSRSVRVCFAVLFAVASLAGCGGGTPAPPPVNPYAAGGASAGADPTTAPPPTPAPAVTQNSPANGANPYGGTNPATSENPYGGSSGTKPTPPPPVAPVQPSPPAVVEMKPEVNPPAESTPKPVVPVTPAAPVEENPSEPIEKPVEKATWSLAVDPAPVGSYGKAGAKLNLKMPSLGPIDPDFVESTRLRVVYPATPGPFAAMGLNDEKKQYREVWNLIEKKKLGQIRNLEFGSSRAQTLSPDGKYLAGKPQWDSSITIFSVEQNKPLTPIKLSGTASKLVAFAGKSRLIFEDNKELRIFAVPEFTPHSVVKLGSWKVDDGWTLSPGGRFFVAITRAGKAVGLTITDLDSGEVAATISLAGKPECLGAAFSVDGKQLAVLLGGDAPRLQVWQVQTGATSGQFDLTEAAAAMTPREYYQGDRLEWFPDHRHLLIGGKAIYDTQEGRLVAEMKASPIYPVRVVSADQVAAAVAGSLITEDFSAVFKSSSGTPPVDPGTPEPENPTPDSKPADRSAVAQIELDEVDWSVKPGKPPAPIKATGRGVEIPQGHIYMGCLSQSPNGVGFVMYTSEALGLDENGLPTAEADTKFWLEPLDLKNGDKQKAIPLPPLSLLMSVSQDGTRVCTQNANGLDRVDVWTVRDGANQASLAPYHDAPPGFDQRVRYAEFVDPFTLLTASVDRLTLWDLATNKAVYEVEIGELRPELSPARDYVAISGPDRRVLYVLDSRTGKPAGSVALSELPNDEVSACEFHPDGRFFAAMTRRVDGGELRVIDISTGETKKQFPLPVTGSILQWVGSDYILLDGASLVSVSRECVAWTYALPVGMHLRNSPDQRHWYIASDPTRSNVYNVRGVDMPDSTIVERIGVSNLHGSTLMAPGQSIDLDVQVADPPGESGFATKVKNILTDRYLGARIKIIPGAPIILSVRDNGESGWTLKLMHDGNAIWTHELDGAEGPQALLGFEPPKHAFPAGASRGAGQSTLTARGTK